MKPTPPRTCKKCGKTFHPYRLKSGEVSAKKLCTDCYPPYWTVQEDILLESLVGRTCPKFLKQVYNRTASRLGYPTRSHAGIKHRMQKLGIGIRPTEENWTATALAELLMIRPSRVYNWIKTHNDLLRAQHYYKFWTITSEGLRNLALNRPSLFWDINPEVLEAAIGEHATAVVKRVARPPSKAVLCVETGVVYPSIYEAARSRLPSRYGIKFNKLLQVRMNIVRAIKRGDYTAYGYHWRFADEQRRAA